MSLRLHSKKFITHKKRSCNNEESDSSIIYCCVPYYFYIADVSPVGLECSIEDPRCLVTAELQRSSLTDQRILVDGGAFMGPSFRAGWVSQSKVLFPGQLHCYRASETTGIPKDSSTFPLRAAILRVYQRLHAGCNLTTNF